MARATFSARLMFLEKTLPESRSSTRSRFRRPLRRHRSRDRDDGAEYLHIDGDVHLPRDVRENGRRVVTLPSARRRDDFRAWATVFATCSSTVFAAFSLMRHPTVVFSSAGSPWTSCFSRATILSVNAFLTELWIRKRLLAQQTCRGCRCARRSSPRPRGRRLRLRGQ